MILFSRQTQQVVYKNEKNIYTNQILPICTQKFTKHICLDVTAIKVKLKTPNKTKVKVVKHAWLVEIIGYSLCCIKTRALALFKKISKKSIKTNQFAQIFTNFCLICKLSKKMLMNCSFHRKLSKKNADGQIAQKLA